jgi:hypothetical protein
LLHSSVDLLLCDGGEIPIFREVLPDESIGIFVGEVAPV